MNKGNLFRECDRLRTFEECPLGNIDRDLLAKLGFYYNQPEGKVKCKFCDLSFTEWQEQYFNPILFHRVYSPLCPIVIHQALRNEPLEVDDITRVNYEAEDTPNCDSGPNERFMTLETRLESFSDWPVGMHTRPEDLAEAGFYYSGRGDIVFCFVCGLKVNQWKIFDDPFVKHAKFSRNCTFLKAIKGEAFIESILQDEMIKLYELETQNSDDILPDDLCSVCYQRRRTMVCVPCGHFVMCERCSDSLKKCPVCGKLLSKKIHAIIL